MSISSVLCKLWRWLVKAATAIVDGVVTVVKALAAGAFEILGALLDGASDFLGNLLGKPLVWLAVGLGAWWLLSGDKKKEKEVRYVPIPQR